MAIPPETAHAWLDGLDSPEAIRKAVKERLLAADPGPLGDGRLDEYPEDVVAVLLEDDAVPQMSKIAVASGWNAALSEVERLMRDPGIEFLPDEIARLEEPFERVFRVAEVTGHTLLETGILRSALPLAVDAETRATPLQVQQVVAAAKAFKPRKADREIWLEAMRNAPHIAGYAFLALLEIDKDRPDLVVLHLLHLMTRQYVDGWDIDTWYLMEFVRTRMGIAPMETALLLFSRQYPEIWQEICQAEHENPCWPEDVVKLLDDLSEAAAVADLERLKVTMEPPIVEVRIIDGVMSELTAIRRRYVASEEATAYGLEETH